MQNQDQLNQNSSEDKSITKTMDNFIANFFGKNNQRKNKDDHIPLWFTVEKPWRP